MRSPCRGGCHAHRCVGEFCTSASRNLSTASGTANDRDNLLPARSQAHINCELRRTAEWLDKQRHKPIFATSSLGSDKPQFALLTRVASGVLAAAVSQQIKTAESPVITADAEGRILLANEAGLETLGVTSDPLLHLEDIAVLFEHTAKMRQMFLDLVTRQRALRIEVVLRNSPRAETSLLVRGDPLLSPPDRLLGFVVLFSDLTERKAPNAARRSFHDEILEERRATTVRLDSRAHCSTRVFSRMLSRMPRSRRLKLSTERTPRKCRVYVTVSGRRYGVRQRYSLISSGTGRAPRRSHPVARPVNTMRLDVRIVQACRGHVFLHFGGTAILR